MKNFWSLYTDNLGSTIFHPQYFMLIAIRDAVNEAKKKTRGKLIDLGCGRMQYRDEFEALAESYTGLDHPKISKDYNGKYNPEILADIHKLPIKNGGFDTALMLQVIEYLEDTPRALNEVSRILKKNSFLIISTPFMYPIHDRGFDRNRFTDVALKSLLKRAKFKVIKIKPHGNFLQFVTLSINVFILKSVKQIGEKQKLFLLFLPLALAITTFFNICANLISHFTESRNSDYIINYSVVAKRM